MENVVDNTMQLRSVYWVLKKNTEIIDVILIINVKIEISRLIDKNNFFYYTFFLLLKYM